MRRIDGLWRAIGGPDAVSLWSSVPVHGEDLTTRATFTVKAGEAADFLMVWHPSHEGVVRHTERAAAVEETCAWWEEWCQQCTYDGEWRDDVLRSLIVLKALTFEPTGGIVAARDDIAAGAAGRGPQLGLPHLLAAETRRSRCTR